MIKQTPKHLERLYDNLRLVKEYASKLSELQSTEKDVFWKALKKIMEKSISSQTELIISTLDQDNIEGTDTVLSKVKYRAGYISACKEILLLVDKNDDACGEAMSKIKELTERIEEVKTNIDLQ
jgi:beta-lactamase superfamily II metal-dependent hydrolase